MMDSAEWRHGKSILNAVGGLLAGYGFVAFFCFLEIVRHWAGVAPTVPVPSLGAIFPHNEHGSITYFTAFQATSCALLFETSIPLGFIGAFIATKKNIKTSQIENLKSPLRFLVGRLTWNWDDPRHIHWRAFLLGALAAPAIVFYLGPDLVHWLIGQGFTLQF